MNRPIMPRLGPPGLVEEGCRREYPSQRIKREVIDCRLVATDADRTCPLGCPGHMESKQPVRTVVRDVPAGTSWRLLNLSYPVLRCRHCGTTRNLRPDWLDVTRPMTSRLISMIEHESHNLTAKEVARRTGVDERVISEIFNAAIRRWRPLTKPQAVRRLGIDEAHIGGKDRGVVVDLDTGHLIGFLKGRTNEDFQAFFATMEGCETVEVVAIDMTRSYLGIALQLFPNVKVVADRWHVTQMAREVVNTWRMRIKKRKAPSKTARNQSQGPKHKPTRKRRAEGEDPGPTVVRAMLQKRSRTLTACEREILDRVLADNPELKIAYDMREALFDVFDQHDRQTAEAMLEAWLARIPAVGQRVPELRKVARTVQAWRDPILAYWTTGRSTNGMTENTNGRIKKIHRESRTMSFGRLQAKATHRLGGRPPMSIVASEMAWDIGTLVKQGWTMEEIRRQVSVYAAQILHPDMGLLDMPGRLDV